ncbi:MAG: response regulator [Candidatus Omnitrophota bacterium]
MKKKKSILIADDDSFFLDNIGRSLTHRGYLVFKAKNGKEAFDLVKEKKPNMVLLDISMPVMDGYSAAEALRRLPETKNIPVIFLTGLVSRDEEKKLEEEFGGCSVLSKPFDFKSLIDEIKKYE